MPINATVIAAVVLLVLILMKVPVFAAILSGSVVYFIMTPDLPTQLISQRITSGIESIPLLAVPFFVCAGVFMNKAGVTRRIMDFCSVVTGRMTGGLAQVNVLLSTLMGGLSGSSLADAAMEAKMLVPEMRRKGFSNEFSSVVTAVSAMITPLIPPGINMILYGSIANVSVGKLFVSGIGVGALLCIALMILVSRISKKRGYLPMRTERLTAQEFWAATRPAIIPLCLPVIIIGGIRIGVFTPTEAGSVAVIYAMVLGFVYKEMNIQDVIDGLKETLLTTAAIMLIVGTSSAFAWILTREQIPQTLTQFMLGLTSNKYVFLIIINLFLLVVGMFIEGSAATIVLVPLLVPMARAFGIDDIQFAMMFIFNLSIGAITPPLGTLMFVTCGVTQCKIKDFLKESIPFFVMLFICLLLVTFIPIVTTGLVDLVY